MNKVILIGRLTKDPELRHTGSGMAVCQITVAINRMGTNQNGDRLTDFINVVVWDKQAENVSKYLSKGRLVAVDGRIQTRNYDGADGKKVYVTEVVASNVQFLESKSASTNDTTSNNVSPFDFENNNSSQPQTISQPTVEIDNDPFANFGESIDISDNDLPF